MANRTIYPFGLSGQQPGGAWPQRMADIEETLNRLAPLAFKNDPPDPETVNYLVFGNPTFDGNIYTPNPNALGFVYSNEEFNPGAGHSWVIQTRIKLKSATAWKDIISSINDADGSMSYSIVSQLTNQDDNRKYTLFVSGNGTSWNLANAECSGLFPFGTWKTFQIVCNYSSGTYTFKQGFPDTGDWTNSYSSQSAPMYGKHIAFGRNMIDADFDLSETKIWIDGQLWWEAITS